MKHIQQPTIHCKTILVIIISILFFLPCYSIDTDIAEMFQKNDEQKLIPDFSDSYGAVFRDLNSDNLPDIYIVRFRNLNRLFLNNGPNKIFKDATIHSGLGGNLMPLGQQNLELGGSSADFNNDGLPDIIIAGWGESTRLFQQHDNFKFLDITISSGINKPLDGNGAVWADVNLDGNLDLFITDEHYQNRFFLGDGFGKFDEVTESWGITGINTSQGAAFGDIDLDGYPDLYVCNWFTNDILYRNTGDNSFKKIILPIKHLTDSLNSNGISLGDIDNDGDLDLLVTDRNGESALYRNNVGLDDNEWSLTDITLNSNLKIPYPAYGSIIADLDNDGLQDIWVNTVGPNILFINKGNEKFEIRFKEPYQFINFKQYYSTGAAVADFDQDGDLDLLVSNKDNHSDLYINPTNNSNYIKIKAIGVHSNRDAIGTKIRLFQQVPEIKERKIVGYHEISGGGGYLSQNSLITHFGVDSKLQYDAEVTFPSGEKIEMQQLTPGKTYTVYENTNLTKLYYRTSQFISRSIKHTDFWKNTFLFVFLSLLFLSSMWFSSYRYGWKVPHLIIFSVLVFTLLFGISVGFQEIPIYNRFIIQIFTFIIFWILISFFYERIRKLEKFRQKYRHLLQDFSKQLILIKDKQELSNRLVKTIYDSVQPSFCVFYSLNKHNLIKGNLYGEYNGPAHIVIPKESHHKILNIDEIIHKIRNEVPLVADGYIFPVSRMENLYGVLLIGKNQKGIPLGHEDISVFKTLTSQAAIAFENNIFIEETKKLTQKVTEAKTREKYVKKLEKANKELEKNNQILNQLYQDLKNTQTQLVQSEKMSGLGQLVAGVAHELNNPISFIYANLKELGNYSRAISQLLDVLQNNFTSPNFREILETTIVDLKKSYDLDFIQKDIESIIAESLEGSRRVKEVVQNLRNFSRLDEAKYKEVDLHEGLNATLLLLKSEFKNRITIHKNYGNIPKILCHPGNINQVFMNILINASQAIETKGNIWIKTEKIKNQIKIEIRDDGKGIPKKAISKIFDPFFSTKPIGKGTGLGLSISYNIIKEHGGIIEVESDKGTIFRIWLPLKT